MQNRRSVRHFVAKGQRTLGNGSNKRPGTEISVVVTGSPSLHALRKAVEVKAAARFGNLPTRRCLEVAVALICNRPPH